MDFDLIAQLSVPNHAAPVAAIVVCTCGYLVFRMPSDWPNATQALYWRGMTLLAEVFVAVGLIGLVTFAGRAKLESNSIEQARLVQDSEHEVSQIFSTLQRNYCFNLQQSIPPLNKIGPIYQACKTLKEFGALYKPGLNWQVAQKQLIEASAVRDATPALTEVTTAASAAIGRMVAARNKASKGPWELEIIRLMVSWKFILFCAILAAVGVSIKCARACKEFLQELRLRTH